jgi:hypothetical protein
MGKDGTSFVAFELCACGVGGLGAVVTVTGFFAAVDA